MKLLMYFLTTIFIAFILVLPALADEPECTQSELYYVFSRPIFQGCGDKPRGGTSNGGDVQINQEVHQGWQAIQNTKSSKFERDRAAILAMSEGYKVDFNFLEKSVF